MGRVKTDDKSKAPDTKEEKPEEKEEDPPIVKQLKEIDDKYLELEREYEKKVQQITNEYNEKQKPLLEERKKVLVTSAEGDAKTGTPALSGFWLKALQNHPAFEESIQEWDEPVLEFLTDVEKTLNETDNSKGFKLTFHFLENPYFENTVLTKEYITEESNPYCGDIDVKEVKSTSIEWKAGKDVTVEKIAKKNKGGKKAKQKGKEKEEPRPSFFRDFFRNLTPDMKLPEDAREMAMSIAEDDDSDGGDEELIQYLLENDHEIGTALRDNIIPFAIRWYTGEAAPEFEAMDDDEDSEEDDDDDDDDDSEESSDEPPKGRGKAKAAAKKGKKGSPELKPADKPQEECKQQ